MTPDTKQAHTPDGGKTLALLMADDKLSAILKTLGKLMRTLDGDDEGYSFEVAHSDLCPARGHYATHHQCGCGLADAIDRLHEAEADANNVREQLALLGRRK